jgi:hypothetical protein
MSYARRRSALIALLVAAVVMLSAGAAAAVSGGAYSQDQQDCPQNGSAWNTPPNYVPNGCHDLKMNLQSGDSGGTGWSDPSSSNTRYAEFGLDKTPNNNGNPSFGGLAEVGDPGTADSPHSGCLAANTAGTGGGTGKGCGNNPNGAGFSATGDYYAVYCPATAAIPLDSIPVPDHVPALKNCVSDQPIGPNGATPDTGTQSTLDQIATHGLLLYFGANDGLDNGEHDGFDGCTQKSALCPDGNTNTDGAINGPSDGGAIVLGVTPQNASNTPTAANPEGLVDFSFGACADGICFGAATQRTTVYQGCDADSLKGTKAAKDDKCAKGTPQNDDVFHNDTPASTKESGDCNGGGPTSSETACYKNADGSANPGGANAYRQNTPHNMNMEPGVQTYQDPDPQRSPAAPVGTPGIYVGTCGVYVNDSGGAGGSGITGQNPGYLGGVNNC